MESQKKYQLFAKNFRYLRKKLKITQDKMSYDLEINRSALSFYENAKSFPDYTELLAIAHYFNVNLDDFLRVDLTQKIVQNSNENTHLIPSKHTHLNTKKESFYSNSPEYTTPEEAIHHYLNSLPKSERTQARQALQKILDRLASVNRQLQQLTHENQLNKTQITAQSNLIKLKDQTIETLQTILDSKQ